MVIKNFAYKIFLFLVLFILLGTINSTFAQKFEKNTIIVKLKPEEAGIFNNKMHLNLNNCNITNIKSIIKNSNRTSKKYNIYKIKTSDKQTVEENCKILEETGLFEYCQPNYYDKILYTPSDPKASKQYTLSITKAYEAWDIHKGDSTIVIGITDTGVDFDHEDLKTNIKYNLNDPIDGIDNDYDGYIDNYMGWDFGSDDNNPQWNQSGTSGNHVHGIFTSGLAGARTDNGKGISSVGFSNKFLPIKISNNNGGITTGYESIIYAAEHGCKIINCSWGSKTPHQYGKDIIKYITEDLGVIIVAAAGNDNNEKLFYPASYDNVVSVAASNSSDLKWPNSSYNWRVDISAPGQNVLSTLSNSTYNYSSGTSFSSPIVSSALALVMSYYPDTLSSRQVIEILKSTSDYIDNIGSNSVYKNKLGKGRINLESALSGNFGAAISCNNFSLTKNGEFAIAGDTAIFSGQIINYLRRIENLEVKIKCNSQYITILDNSMTISSLDENEEASLENSNLRVILHDNIPNHSSIFFELEYSNDNYTNSELRVISVNLPNIEVNKNRIHTSVFPSGSIAYNSSRDGFGFLLDNNEDILFEMGIVNGYSDTNLTANIRSYNDFESIIELDSLTNNGVWKANGTVKIKSLTKSIINFEYLIYNQAKYNNILFINYQIINTSEVNWDEYYFGIFADWDIYLHNKNFTTIDSNLVLASTHCWNHNEIASIQLLSHSDWNRYAFNNITNSEIISTNGFTREEFYLALRSNNHFVGIKDDGTDILDLLSAGPFNLDINDTLKLSFAIMADTSLYGIHNTAINAQNLYDSLYIGDLSIKELGKTNNIYFYPNPSNTIINIVNKDIKWVEIYDISGRLQIYFTTYDKENIVDIKSLKKGMYIIKFNTKKGSISQRLIVN